MGFLYLNYPYGDPFQVQDPLRRNPLRISLIGVFLFRGNLWKQKTGSVVSAKLPWTKWHWQDWLSDPALQMASPCSRGIWANFLGYMDKDRTHYITGSRDELCRLGGCSRKELVAFLLDAKKSRFCDVTLRHKKVTVKSRRLEREHKIRENNRLRKQRARSHGDVTGLSPGEAEAEAYTEAYTEKAKDLKALCEEIQNKVPRKYFNPYEFITMTKKWPIECHIDLMGRLLKNESFMNQEVDSGRAYAQTIFNIEAQNVCARLSEQEAKQHAD